jgi:hypothetical protein
VKLGFKKLLYFEYKFDIVICQELIIVFFFYNCYYNLREVS